MIRNILMMALAAVAFVASADAQDISGDWQGTLGGSPQGLRVILKITKGDGGTWNATLFSIDRGGFDQGIPVDSVTQQGSDVKFTVGAVRGAYEGKISADGASI